MSNRTKGVIFIIISALGFALMSAFIKLSGDLPSFQKAFFRNLVACVIAFIIIVYKKESFFGKKESQKFLILRSLLGTIGIVTNYYAIDHLILSDANMLNKLNPFFVIILSAIFLKENINLNQIISLIIAFMGSLFIIKPSFNLNLIPFLVGIISALCSAIAYTCLRFLGDKEKYYTIVFYFSLFSTVTLLPIALIVYKPMTIIQLIYLVLAGICATIGQFGITLAYKYAPAKEVSIFDYSNIVFSALLSIFLFSQFPDIFSLVGYFIIFGSSYYIFLYNKKLDNLEINKKEVN